MNARMPRIRVAGVVTRGDKLLTVIHEREGRRYYLLPGGGLEWGETAEQALRREFEEELSLQVRVGTLLAVSESISPDGKRHILNLTFHCRLSKGTLAVHPDRRLRGAAWLSRSELANVVFFPEIRPVLARAWKERFRRSHGLVKTPWN